MPALAHREVGLVIATVETAGPQRPDEGLETRVAQRAKILAAGMIEIAIDRKNPRADELASAGIDDPGRGHLREALDLLGNPLVQRFFPGADLGIGLTGEQVVDARRDQDVRIEYLGRILRGNGNRLGKRDRGRPVTRLV